VERFHEFAEESGPLDGDKIRIDDVLNKELIVTGYRIKESKYPKSGSKCLMLQVVLDDKKFVLFTGSVVLSEQMEKYQAHLPFLATIRKIDRYYTLT
jgi:hypothetical protein